MVIVSLQNLSSGFFSFFTRRILFFIYLFVTIRVHGRKAFSRVRVTVIDRFVFLFSR